MAIKRTREQSSDHPKPKTPKKKTKSNQTNLLQPEATKQEQGKQEEKIRPYSFENYLGQEELKDILKVAMDAAKARNEALDHLLLYGPPGLGKTTMSLILAAEMGVNCKITSAPALERPRDITGLLVNLKANDILFIDEIHRLNRMSEELLYTAMEDYRLDITIGKGQSARIRSIDLNKFTLVGATTNIGSLTSPLRSRFGLIQRLRFYYPEELTEIIIRSAKVLKINITQEGAAEIAKRSRGTPRIANRLLKRVRDYAQVEKVALIEANFAGESLNKLNVDTEGLDEMDRSILTTIMKQFKGGPVGLEAIAAAIGEDKKTLEEVYEPFLLQNEFLSRTPRGRVATEKAQKHLNIVVESTKS